MNKIDISAFNDTVTKIILDKSEVSKIILSHCSEEEKDEVEDLLKEESKEEIENTLEIKTKNFLDSFYEDAFYGESDINELLYSFSCSKREEILSDIRKYNEHLYNLVVERLFSFDCIKFLDDRDIQRILDNTDDSVLALSLKNASDEVFEKFRKNTDKKHFANLLEDMEFMGPVKAKAVANAQNKICQTLVKIYKDMGKELSTTPEKFIP